MTFNPSQFATDPAAFRSLLRIDTDGGPRPLAECLDDWQRADFEALDDAWRSVAGQDVPGATRRAWIERPRGHSKTSDVAAMASFALLTPHRRLPGVCAAADQDQARLLAAAIAKLCQLNSLLGNLLEVQRDRVVNRHTGSELLILSNDAPSSYGLTPDFIICDEISHWGERRELWDSLLSAAAKRGHCLLLVIGNAGWADTWQHATREIVRADADWYFHALPGPVASWIAEKQLDEQRRLLPAIAFARLWGNQWTSGTGDALQGDDITAAIVADLQPMKRARPGWLFTGGLDLGIKRDSSALVIVGKRVGETRIIEQQPKRQHRMLETMNDLGLLEPDDDDDFDWDAEPLERVRRVQGDGRLRLAKVCVWRPAGGAVDLDEIERRIIKIHNRLGLTRLAVDPWQGVHLTQRLERAGVPVELVPFAPAALQTMATATLEAFRDRHIDLFPHEQMIADLRALRVAERQYGYRLESPRGPNGHGDCATALALALRAASEFEEPLGDIDFQPGTFGRLAF